MIILSTILIFEILRWIILLGEFYFAKRIYHVIKRNNQFEQRLTQLCLLLRSTPYSSGPPPNPIMLPSSTASSSPNAMVARLLLGERIPPFSQKLWQQLAMGICLGSVFLSVFLTTIYLLRPITFHWVLGVLPLILPLILLPLPYLLRLPSSVTLFLLGLGIGVGVLMLLIPGV